MQNVNAAQALHSGEAEQQLLGAALANNERFEQIAGLLKPEHFAEPIHGLIWKHICARMADDSIADPVTVGADMEAGDALSELGGKSYLLRLVVSAASTHQIKEYAKIVIELHSRRTLVAQIEQISADLKAGGSVDDGASALELVLHDRQEASDNPRTMSLLKAQTLAIDQMHEIQKGGFVGCPTGISDLDAAVSLTPKRYTILGGATSMGKSALALSIVKASAEAGFGVGFVTREMPEEDLANRLNSMDSKIPYKAYDRKMSENSFREVVEAAKKQQSLPIEIFSDRVSDVPSILSEAKKLKRKMVPNGNFKGLKLLVVDYLQLINGKGESGHVRLAQVANDLKAVAKILDVHVLALAQIDRTIGARDDTRPKLADLRGSGDLEMAPDNVLFIHRPGYYLERQTPPKKEEDRVDWEYEVSQWSGKAEVIVAKARMGEICAVKVACNLAINQFTDLQSDYQEEAF